MAVNKMKLKIYGQVQGVGMRLAVSSVAQNLNLTGWVKNCSDGSVELFAEGLMENLSTLLDWCYIGSQGEIISKIDVLWEEGPVQFADFNIIG